VKRVAAPETEKAKQFNNSLSAANGMITVFWNCAEVIVVDAMPRRRQSPSTPKSGR
jgi:hypothetical protein